MKTPVYRQVFLGGDSLDSLFVPDPNLNLFLASRMRELRRRHGLTQEQTAALVGCDYKYYQAIEAGAKDIRLSMIERLALPFGLRPEQIFSKELPPTKVAGQA